VKGFLGEVVIAGEWGGVLEGFEALQGRLVGYVQREGGESLLFPSLTFRSSGGLGGSLPFGLGMFGRGADPVNQNSDCVFEPWLTVAKLLEPGFTVYIGLCHPRHAAVAEGSLGTL